MVWGIYLSLHANELVYTELVYTEIVFRVNMKRQVRQQIERRVVLCVRNVSGACDDQSL